MLHCKILIALASAGLLAGSAVVLLQPSDQGDQRLTPPGSSNDIVGRSSVGKSSRNGDPTEPWAELFDRVRREGIAAVRSEMHALVQRHVRQLEPAKAKPLDPSFGYATAQHALVTMNLATGWAASEARAIFQGDPVPDDFDEAIWKPLFEAAVSSRDSYAHVLQQLERLHDERFPEDDTEIDDPSEDEVQREVRALERERRPEILKAALRRLRHSGPPNAENLFLRLAELAKIAKRPDLVEQVYDTYDAGLPKQDPMMTQIGKLESAREFLDYDHKVFDKKYGVHLPPPPDPPVPGSKFPVTEEEQKAIRDMLETLREALIARDRDTLLNLAVGDRDKLKQTLEEELAEITTLSYDMSQARFEFFRDEANGPVRVHVEDIIVDRIISGKRQKGQTRKTYHIVFVNGKPRVRIQEE